MGTRYAIETRALLMHYPGREEPSLKGVNLRVEYGEIFGYLGPNGAGKTTTIKILVGLLRPSGGEAFLLGRSIRDTSVRRLVGYLPEDPDFYGYLSARETLWFLGRLSGMDRSQLRRRVPECLETVGLSYAAETRVAGFSRGMRQRLGVAQAILHEPELLVLDEPLSGLDPVGRYRIKNVILELARKGTTVLFSSHILPDVESLCDRVGIIHRGELLETLSVEEVAERTTLHYEIVFSIDDEEAVRSVAADGRGHLKQMEGRYLMQLPDESALNNALRRLLEAGGKVHSVARQQSTLEEYFMKKLEQVDERSSDGGD